MSAYVLDHAQQEKLNLEQLLSAMIRWFYSGSHNHPLSFEFSRLGVSPVTNKIYKTFELSHVTRLVGNGFQFELNAPPKIRRRRVQLIPAGAEVRLKRSAPQNDVLVSLSSAIADRAHEELSTGTALKHEQDQRSSFEMSST